MAMPAHYHTIPVSCWLNHKPASLLSAYAVSNKKITLLNYGTKHNSYGTELQYKIYRADIWMAMTVSPTTIAYPSTLLASGHRVANYLSVRGSWLLSAAWLPLLSTCWHFPSALFHLVHPLAGLFHLVLQCLSVRVLRISLDVTMPHASWSDPSALCTLSIGGCCWTRWVSWAATFKAVSAILSALGTWRHFITHNPVSWPLF